MAEYSNTSKEKLITVHIDLQMIFNEVIKIFDNTIIYGYREPQLQFDLFKKGRSNIGGFWIIVNKKEVVTYCDGIKLKSNHNKYPSNAIDAIPYPIDWKDEKRIHYFAGFVMCTALRLKEEGKITHNIRWGGDWDNDTEVKDEIFMDLAHYEIIE